MIQNCKTKKVYERLPMYLDYLNKIDRESVSSTIIANNLNLGEVQVRKDLALVSGKGRPKIGYLRKNLIKDISKFMGFDQKHKAIIIGYGKLGRALYNFKGFENFGIEIVAAFDINNKDVLDINHLCEYCSGNDIKFGIITVPNESAQSVADKLIQCGIKGIWNFSSIRLQVPNEIIVQNENLATSFSVLIKETEDRQ